MDQLRAMRTFAKVIEEGGFAAAARAMDTAPAVVTRVIAELEEHLGARLIQRTTRRLVLTDIGEAYLARARQILADVEDADAMASVAQAEVKGHLSVLSTPAFAVHQLAKLLPRFAERYPQVSLEIHAPGPVTTVDENHDVSLVIVRDLVAGDFVARRLARSEIITCASPEYLARFGRPHHPHDLLGHRAIIPPISDVQRGLTFVRGDERVTVSPPRAALSTTHVDTMYAAALGGLGIAGLPSFVIEDALIEDALERVLPEWRLFDSTVWAAMPSRKHLPARTRAFVDFLVETLGGMDEDPWLQAAGCATQPPLKIAGRG